MKTCSRQFWCDGKTLKYVEGAVRPQIECIQENVNCVYGLIKQDCLLTINRLIKIADLSNGIYFTCFYALFFILGCV